MARGDHFVARVHHIVAGHIVVPVEVLEEELRNARVEVQEELQTVPAEGQEVHYNHHVVEGTVVLEEGQEVHYSHRVVEGIAGLEEDREERHKIAVVGMEVVLGEDTVGRSPAAGDIRNS